uniref:Uncharacterized protein n=1 Tax=Avena sativa TaxID=4498 RepID=A0ACD5VD23_AVESA
MGVMRHIVEGDHPYLRYSHFQPPPQSQKKGVRSRGRSDASRQTLMVRLYDLCCDRRSQRTSSSLIKCLPFVVPAIVVGAASVLLLLRFVVTPHIEGYIEDARLTSFASSNSSSFAAYKYNITISVALAVRNPNAAMDIKYTKPLVAAFLFDDRRLYNVTVAEEGHKQKRRKRDVHLLRTGGDVLSVLDSAAVEEFKKQKATGVFKVEMRLSGEITLAIGNSRVLELSCPMTLQPPPTGPDPDVVVFREVDCKPDKPKRIVF